MGCFPELTYAIYVDGELPPDEMNRVRMHVSACAHCRNIVAAFTAENRMLTATMADATRWAAARRRNAWVELAGVAAVLALTGGVIEWINQQSLPAALNWLNIFTSEGRSNFAFNLFFYLSSGGAEVLEHLATVVGWVLLLAATAAGLFALARHQGRYRSRLSLIGLALLVSLPSLAIETRTHNKSLTVKQSETVNDTLCVSAESVEIDGVVNGDLITAARSVTVRGTVKGNIFSWSKNVELDGSVGGSIFSFAQQAIVRGHVGHSVYSFVQFLRVEPGAQVASDIIVASQEADIAGKIDGSVTAFAALVNVRADIGRSIIARVGEINLDNPTHVAGGLLARVRHSSDVRIADGVTIGGPKEVKLLVRPSRFSSRWFFIWRAIGLFGAFLVGWVVMYLFPGFFQTAARAVGSGWRTFGLGFIVLVAVPIACVLVALSLIGLPLALISLGLYLIGLRLATILVGAFLGSLIFKSAQPRTGEGLLALFFGLLILTVVFQVPFIGALVKFLTLCLGLGALSWQLYRTRQAGNHISVG